MIENGVLNSGLVHQRRCGVPEGVIRPIALPFSIQKGR
jgi:hypothetical protein